MIDIRGLFNFSLVDYPGKICCIVFMAGCNFRCPFCHNPCLVFDPHSQPLITEKQFFHFLEQRKGKLEGVVISGGEPTLQPELESFIADIRKAGFLVKLDTNGSKPDVVEHLISNASIDAFGIDYKAPSARYAELTSCKSPNIAEAVKTGISLVRKSGLPLDVRTTVHRKLLSPDDLKTMYSELSELGVVQWTLQQFHSVDVIDDELLKITTYEDHELMSIARSISPNVRVRGLTGRIL